jgi:NAD+ synthase (glutamine-hydrolysing)
VKIALGQINTTIGDFSGNTAKIIEYSERARAAGASVILFPELAICGYPPRDLVEKPSFVQQNWQALENIKSSARGITVITGLVTKAEAQTGKSVLNSAAVIRDGKLEMLQSKMLLPTYDVFDESRNFAPAESQKLIQVADRKVALTICEDAWNDKHFWNRRLYQFDPVESLLNSGGDIVLNISASPFYVGKPDLRRNMLAAIARNDKVPVVMVNLVGGNDSIIFDGSSMVIAPDGRVVAQGKSFEEDLVFFDTETMSGDMHEPIGDELASAYQALVLGTRDYVRKCGFGRVIIGLSGGIDSALTAAIAADAVGPENVIGVGMPSPYSSGGSIDDARALACNLGVRFELIPIVDVFDAYLRTLKPVFEGLPEDTTEENIQSRIRGALLMAMSNKLSALVLSTGNKSELGVGYCTLYGDMVGGLAVISDVPKTMVYRLSHYVNSKREIIPRNTIEKPPSAELKPNQVDQDTLPPYDMLDAILEDYVESYKSAEEIARSHGFDLDLVKKVMRMVDRAEYKRQQAAVGLKISEKAFGMGRRMPIAMKSIV